MTRCRPGIVASCAVVLLAVAAHTTKAQRPDTLLARVTYVSGNSVYIDAGQRNGLTEGATLDVRRNGSGIAQLRVRFLSPGRSQCDVVMAASALMVGDTVRYVRQGAGAPPPMDTTPPVMPTAAPRPGVSIARPQTLHGRVGVRYLAAWQRDSGSARLAQPASDIRIDGTLPGLPSLDVSIDARARQTRTIAIDGVLLPSHTSTLVYQSWIAWNAPARTQLRVGRQYSSELASVSLFDGALLAVNRTHFSVAAFGGTQPDVETMRYSTRVREYGAYATARVTPWTAASATVSLGAVSSYDGGQVDRDFAFAAASWSDGIVSFHAMQELDYNRGWKRAAGEPTITPTSTYASLRVRALDVLAFSAGYDSRRSVRLYRNYVSPAIAFDDTYRTGVWGGIFAEPTRRTTASVDLRHSSGGPSANTSSGTGSADIVTFSASARDLWYAALVARGRTSYYRSPAARGWLHAMNLSGIPTEALQVDIGGGLRTDIPAAGTASAAISDRLTVRWLEISLDLAVGRSWYVLVSASRERGGWEANDQLYWALSYRF